MPYYFDIKKEISDLLIIGKLNFSLPAKSLRIGRDKGGRFILTLTSEFQHLLKKLNNVFLIYTDHRVRYGKIDILDVFSGNKAIVSIQDEDLHEELLKEKSVNIALDEEEINHIDDDTIYFDPVGMKVFWTEKEIGVIKDFFYNGAHYVYEIELTDNKTILVPDVDAFVEETNIEERFIKLIEFEQFIY